MLRTALQYSHQLLSDCINTGDYVIDATIGNGNDTLFLAELVGETGTVYGFDIQQAAVDKTEKRLQQNNMMQQTSLSLLSHEHVDQVIQPETVISAAVFNLGYLPRGDKSVTTKPQTTITAIKKILPLLKSGGRIVLVVYDGHAEGKVEKDALLSFVRQLPQEDFSVLYYAFLNQRNHPPSVIAIEKKPSPVV